MTNENLLKTIKKFEERKSYNSNNINRKEQRNNDNTNKKANKQTNKNTHYWQIVKIDIQQYGKIRWSLLWQRHQFS